MPRDAKRSSYFRLRCLVIERSISSSGTMARSLLSTIVKNFSPWMCTKKQSSLSRWNGVVEFGEDTDKKPSTCSKSASSRLLKPRARATEKQRVFQQPAILRRILHALEHRPCARGLDALHHFDRIEIEVRDRIRILADRDLA